MGEIFLQWQGNGHAYVDDYYPVNNQRVTLTCVPDAGSSLDRIIATDSYDHSIALLQTEIQSFVFRGQWHNMYIEVYFSGSTPPEPPAPYFDINLLAAFKRKKKNKKIFRF